MDSLVSFILFPFKVLSKPAVVIAGLIGVIFVSCLAAILFEMAFQTWMISLESWKRLLVSFVVGLLTFVSAYHD